MLTVFILWRPNHHQGIKTDGAHTFDVAVHIIQLIVFFALLFKPSLSSPIQMEQYMYTFARLYVNMAQCLLICNDF